MIKKLLILVMLVFIVGVSSAIVYPEVTYTINDSTTTVIKTDDNSGTHKVKPIDKNTGQEVGIEVDANELPNDKESVTKIILENTTKLLKVEKKVNVRPNAKLIFSSDSKQLKQSRNGSAKLLEISYNYHESYMVPWTDYVRVDLCQNGICRVVNANFTTKRVWLEYKPESQVDAIIDSDAIPKVEEIRA